jgi:hypothetical protein
LAAIEAAPAAPAQAAPAQAAPKKKKGNPRQWNTDVNRILKQLTKGETNRVLALLKDQPPFPRGDATRILTLRKQIFKAMSKQNGNDPAEMSLASLQTDPESVVEDVHDAMLRGCLIAGVKMVISAVQALELFGVEVLDGETMSKLKEVMGGVHLPEVTHTEVEEMTTGVEQWIDLHQETPEQRATRLEQRRKKAASKAASSEAASSEAASSKATSNDVVVVRVVLPESEYDGPDQDGKRKRRNDDDAPQVANAPVPDLQDEDPQVMDVDNDKPVEFPFDQTIMWADSGNNSSDEDEEAAEHEQRVYGCLSKKAKGEPVSQEEQDLFGGLSEFSNDD